MRCRLLRLKAYQLRLMPSEPRRQGAALTKAPPQVPNRPILNIQFSRFRPCPARPIERARPEAIFKKGANLSYRAGKILQGTGGNTTLMTSFGNTWPPTRTIPNTPHLNLAV